MERRTTAWYSHNLGMEMPLVAYGHAGPPLLMFPTAAADYLEYERFHLVDAIKHHIEAGRLRAYSINSVNRYSLLNEQAPPHVKAELLTRYDRYVTDEVLPLIPLVAPFAPHIAEELWEQTGGTGSVFDSAWPSFDPSLAAEDSIELVVQVNGKVRTRILVPPDISEEAAVDAALADATVARFVAGAPKKIIFVPGRLLNIVA